MADHLTPLTRNHVLAGYFFAIGEGLFWVVGGDALPEVRDDVDHIVGGDFAVACDGLVVGSIEGGHVPE